MLIKSSTITVVFLTAVLFFSNIYAESKVVSSENVYDFKVETIDGEEVQLDKYKGKVLLIVNTASECGFTPQYEGLEDLYKKYSDKGFEILGFPCNQFGSQEPGSNEEIKKFCTSKFSVTFPLFSKIKVNGEEADPLYKYLKSEQSGLITDDIKWNFTKFLIDKNGNPIERYGSRKKPEKLENDIEEALSN